MRISRGKSFVCDAQVVRSLKDKMRGLMGRTLEESEGMLFVFPCPGYHSIWMMGMKQEIDICFVDEKKRVINVFCAAPPLTLDPRSWRLFFPKRPAKYVLELSPRSGIREGDVLTWGKA